MEYPKDKETFQCSDQFLLGSDVLIAPILRPGQTHRSVYLPEGEWYDFWTEEKYQGRKYHLISAELDTLPIFVKAGTILPLGTDVQNTKEIQDINLCIYHSDKVEATGTLYEDDGSSYDYQKGHYSLSTFMIKDGQLETTRKGSYQNYAQIKDIKIIGRKEAGENE